MDTNPTTAAAARGEISRPIAYAMLVLAPLLFATGVVIVRGTHESMPPVGLSFWRWLIAGIGFLPFIAGRLGSDIAVAIRAWRYFAMMGGFMVGGSALSAIALNLTTATNASLVNASQPALTGLIAFALVGMRLSRLHAAGIVLAAIGIAVMVSRADLAVLRTLSFNPGDLVMLIVVVFYVIYAIRLAKLPHGMTFAGAMCAVALFGSLELLPIYVVESIFVRSIPATGAAIGMLVYLGLIASMIPVYLWSRAVPIVGPNQSAIFVNLMPVFAASLAFLFLDERLYAYHIAGAALIFGGILIVIQAETRRRRGA